MSYVTPNSTINFLYDVPLDVTYDHSIWFPNAVTQSSYFEGKVKSRIRDKSTQDWVYFSLTEQSYTRVSDKVVRVAINAENLYDCNYIMFKNTAFGSKWFYAFVTDIKYVNNKTSEVTFVLDVLQTWYFDYDFGDCYIEREHTTSDVIGENTLDEGLPTGEYICNYQESILTRRNPAVIFLQTFAGTYDPDEPDYGYYDYTGGITDGVFTGLFVNSFALTTAGLPAIRTHIEHVQKAGKSDGIISVFVQPDYAPATTEPVDITITKRQGDINNYVPRNKKLFVYPYNALHIWTDTDSRDFKYEFFNGNSCTFTLKSSIIPNPAYSLEPYNYLAESTTIEKNEMRLMIKDFPECSYNNDIYKVYMAQNKASFITNMLSSVGGTIASAATLDVGGSVSGVTGIVSDIAKLADKQRLAPEAKGTQTSLSDYYFGNKEFKAGQYTIRAEMARVIDNYFDMFGYKTARLGKPYRKARKHWTYFKTRGCDLHGSIPAPDMAKICSIYDNGITYWDYQSDVGEYKEYAYGDAGYTDNTPIASPVH